MDRHILCRYIGRVDCYNRKIVRDTILVEQEMRNTDHTWYNYQEKFHPVPQCLDHLNQH